MNCNYLYEYEYPVTTINYFWCFPVGVKFIWLFFGKCESIVNFRVDSWVYFWQTINLNFFACPYKLRECPIDRVLFVWATKFNYFFTKLTLLRWVHSPTEIWSGSFVTICLTKLVLIICSVFTCQTTTTSTWSPPRDFPALLKKEKNKIHLITRNDSREETRRKLPAVVRIQLAFLIDNLNRVRVYL